MKARFQTEQTQAARYLPKNTRHVQADDRDIWIFEKSTEVGIRFEIALYFDADEDEPGYCAQLISPEIESAWRSPHVGHIFSDGVICFGGASMRTRKSLREAFSKSCLWAEGMAIMIVSQLRGSPSFFPFSKNNGHGDIR